MKHKRFDEKSLTDNNLIIKEGKKGSYFSKESSNTYKVNNSVKKKKLLIALLISIVFVFIIIAFIMSGISNEKNDYFDYNIPVESTTLSKYQKNIKIKSVLNILFSTYDIKIFIDDVEQGVIKNGCFSEYSIELEEGEHILKAYSFDDESVYGEYYFYVYDNENMQFELNSYNNEISIDETDFEEESTTKKVIPDTSAETTDATTYLNDTTTQKNDILTVNNCSDLKELLALKNPEDPMVENFADKYYGKTIKFDGCIMLKDNYIDYKGKVYNTRFNVMLGAGDFDENSYKGPNFRAENVGDYLVRNVNYGQNVEVKAVVGDYDSNTTIFSVNIISVKKR